MTRRHTFLAIAGAIVVALVLLALWPAKSAADSVPGDGLPGGG